MLIVRCFALRRHPLLLPGAGVRGHPVRRMPLRCSPSLWSMVFPLGRGVRGA